MRADNILATIGNTPVIRMHRLFGDAEVWIKSERANPGGSIKDRIALSMVEDAEKAGKLGRGGTIIEPTSGNTGIGLAMVAAVKGYKCILVMPDSMSVERRRLMLAYGARLVLTPRAEGIKGSIAKAREILAQTPGGWIPQQFENAANVRVHMETTAREIFGDFPDGLDAIVTGVGTGGHITGCAKVLKKSWPDLKVFAVEPTASPVISGARTRRTRSRASARASSPRSLRWRCSTARSRWKAMPRRRWRAAARARKASSWASRRAPRCRPSRRS